MPVSRSRKKKSRTPRKPVIPKPKPYEVVKHEMFEYQNPFPEDMPLKERLGIIQKIGDEAVSNFEKDYERLQQYFKEYDPLYLLSFSVLYFLAHQEGIDREAIEGKDEFPPFYVEVLQCLCLFQERTPSLKPFTDQAQDFYKLLQSLNQNQSYRYYKLTEPVQNHQELHTVMLRMEMMIHTLAVRNWAYEPQMEQTAYDLAELIEQEFTKKIGMSPTQLLNILFNSVELMNNRLNIHINRLRSIFRAKSHQEAFDRSQEAFPNIDYGKEDTKQAIWLQSGKNIKNLTFMLCSRADMELPEVFSFSIKDLSELSDIKCADGILIEIFDSLSYEFGDLKYLDKNHIFLNNPTHQKPFIKLENKQYFSAINFLLFHLGVDLLENIIARDTTLKNNYLKAKGKYLENRLEELFRKSFPTATFFSGSLWTDLKDNKGYENDLVVLLNDFAFVIEAKSGTITPPARRGATERLFKTLNELVIAPSEQAIRFQNYLKENAQIHQFKTKNGTVNTIDSSHIKYYVPLGVTLSNLGSIGCNLKKLIEAGMINHKLEELAPSISITDLEVIFELLPLESQKVHYLSRRREFEAHLQFQGDELDLFAFYLDNAFNIGDSEYDKDFHINLTIKSKELDPYIIGKSRGVSVIKPALKMTAFWSSLLTKIESRKGKMWLQTCYMLLNAPEPDQRKFEQAFSQLKGRIIKGTVQKEHNWFVFTCGPARRRYAIIGYPYRNITISKRNEIIDEIVAQVNKDEMRGILLIGQDLNSQQYPYSFIAGTMETNFFDSLEIE